MVVVELVAVEEEDMEFTNLKCQIYHHQYPLKLEVEELSLLIQVVLMEQQ